MCGDGIEHMNAWKNICGSICPVDEAHQPDKNVVSGKFCRPQQVSIGINGGNDQKQCHSRIDHRDVFKKCGLVMKEQPQIYHCDIAKP